MNKVESFLKMTLSFCDIKLKGISVNVPVKKLLDLKLENIKMDFSVSNTTLFPELLMSAEVTQDPVSPF
ncbi:hypothetical protein N9Z00_04500, partial [Flavobacteriaceae bacterium]|nr:hypothetical protein [Flavobacteriaceae bacterium]